MKKLLITIANAYRRSPLAKGIVNAIPYGSGLDAYLVAIAEKTEPNAIKCEGTIQLLIAAIQSFDTKELGPFRVWKRDEEVRRLIFEILVFHRRNTYSMDSPAFLVYDHGDETGTEPVTVNMLRPIYCMLFERSLLWQDPHNGKMLITDFGKEVLRYLVKA